MTVENQVWLEEHYSSKHISDAIVEDLRSNSQIDLLMDQMAIALVKWAESPSTYESKAKRKVTLLESYFVEDGEGFLQNMFHKLVDKILVKIVVSEYPTINNIASQLIGITKLEKRDALILACEVIAVCAKFGLYHLKRVDDLIMVVCKVSVDDAVKEYIAQTTYIPPLVTPPKLIKSNFDTPYYTYGGESLILGNPINHHNEDICLDVINTQNSIKLSLSMDFIACYEEPEPDHQAKAKEDGKVLTPKQLEIAKENWEKYQKQARFFCHLLNGFGNCIWLGNRVDKRGRMYASGYHVSPQGNSYRKAVIELHDKEHLEVPAEYRNF